MYQKKTLRYIKPLLVTLAIILTSITIPALAETQQTRGGMVGMLRGGFGVKAPIDNYQLAWGNRAIDWTVVVEGDFVLFGYNSGSIAPMGKGTARTPLLPPTMGLGPVTVTLTITSQGSTLEQITRTGYIIGPFIFLGF